MKKLFKALSAVIVITLFAGSLSMAALAADYNWSDIAADVEEADIASSFVIDENFGIQYWLPDIFTKDKIAEEEKEIGLITRYVDPDYEWSIELYSYNYEEGAYADLKEYQAFLEEIGYENIHNDTINGMEVLTYGQEDTDQATVTFMDRNGEIAEMIFYPMSDQEFNSVASAIMLSIQSVNVLLWDEISSMLEESEIEGTFYEVDGLDLAYWVPNDLSEIELDEDADETRKIAAYTDENEEFAFYLQRFTTEDFAKTVTEDDEKAKKEADEKKSDEELDKETEETAVEEGLSFTEEYVAELIEASGGSEIEEIYINGLAGISCRYEEEDILSIALFSDESLITFNFTPASDDNYTAVIYAIASSIQSTIIEMNWEEIEEQVNEKIEGGFYLYEDVNVAVWIPEIMKEVELTQEDVENGILGVYATEDDENAISVKQTQLGEDASYEELLEFLADIGATDITKAVVNGSRAVIYNLEDDGTGSIMLMNDDSDFLLEVQFYPISDEGFMSVAEIVMASAMFTSSEE